MLKSLLTSLLLGSIIGVTASESDCDCTECGFGNLAGHSVTISAIDGSGQQIGVVDENGCITYTPVLEGGGCGGIRIQDNHGPFQTEIPPRT